jgi:N-acylneuraminate cytidylyltransferase
VVKLNRFSWNANGSPQNYDVLNRPRRQDFEGLLIENGAVYATTKDAFCGQNRGPVGYWSSGNGGS